MKLSVVIPVYGSAQILDECHKYFSEAVSALTPDYEILFRYDCSPDDSMKVLNGLAQKDPHVRVFANERNLGLGYTLRQLFKDARGEYVIYFDADAYKCFDITVLPNFMEMIKQYDVIVASRYELSRENIPLSRIYASRIYCRLSKLLFSVTVKDPGSGFVLFRKRVLDSIKLNSYGFDIHIEIFAKIQKAGYKVKEVDVNYNHWFGGSFSVFKHGPKVLKDTFRVWREIHKNKKQE